LIQLYRLYGGENMANIKGQMKRNLQNERNRQANAAFKSSVRTAVKAVRVAVEEKDLETATSALQFAFKKLDKAVTKGIYKKQLAARQKSQLSKLVNTLK
jgi:small subunit ribosomal protein S20